MTRRRIKLHGEVISIMLRGSVQFWGDEARPGELPTHYNSYFVFASPWETPGSGVATILLLAGDEPLHQRNFLAEKGGQDAAFDKAVAFLKSLPGNQALHFREERE